MNVRFLGQLTRKMGKRIKFTDLLLGNMIARIIKNHMRSLLRQEMKTLKVCTDEPYRVLVTDFLNLVFANTKDSRIYWSTYVIQQLNSYFQLNSNNWPYFPADLRSHMMNSEGECNQTFPPFFCFLTQAHSPLTQKNGGEDLDKRFYLVKTIQEMSGLVIAPSLIKLLHTATFYEQERIFDDSDILDLGERVKQLSVTAISQGFVFSSRAAQKEKQGYYNAARELYARALEAYENALDSDPLDPSLLRNCALTRVKLYLIDNHSPVGKIERSAPEIMKADLYFRKALRADSENLSSLNQYGAFLAASGRLRAAEEHLLESLDIDPNQKDVLWRYAAVLMEMEEKEWAIKFKNRAAQLR